MTNWVQKLTEAPCICGSWVTNTGDKDCPTCHGTGALVPGLRQECPSNSTRCTTRQGWVHDECQGRGWVLIPEAEQMGVLVRFEDGITLYKAHGNKWRAKLPFVRTFGIWGIGDTPEEALAHASCQAQGVQ